MLNNSNVDSVSDSQIVNTPAQLGGGEGVEGGSLPTPLPALTEYCAESPIQQSLQSNQQPANTDSTLNQQADAHLVLNNSNLGSVGDLGIVNTPTQQQRREGVIASTPAFIISPPLKEGDCAQYTGVKFQHLYRDVALTIHSLDSSWGVASCRTPEGNITTWLPFTDLRRV